MIMVDSCRLFFKGPLNTQKNLKYAGFPFVPPGFGRSSSPGARLETKNPAIGGVLVGAKVLCRV
jgi:hypothetical protein